VSQGQYVAAAYGVVFAVVLLYVAIIAAKLARLQREIAPLLELARADGSGRPGRSPVYAGRVTESSGPEPEGDSA
jgi:CcmD family protein